MKEVSKVKMARKVWSKKDYSYLINFLSDNWNKYDYSNVLKDLQEQMGISKGALTTAMKSFYLINEGVEPQMITGGPGSNFTTNQIEAFVEWKAGNNLGRNMINEILNK